MGIVESYAPESQLRKWDARARAAELELIPNGPRPSGRHQSCASADKADEGGERALARGHSQAASVREAT
eukprot:7596959-Pyramimonas_sp.AAC.1